MRKVKFPFVLTFLFSVGLSSTSCTYAPEELMSLDKTLSAYERAIRWRDFTFARELQSKPENVSDYQRQRLKNVRVTSYKVIKKVIAPDYSKTELVVDIRYYFDNSVVERVITHRQTWSHDKAKNRWQLETAFPNFKLY